jgi:hypothetical protein
MVRQTHIALNDQQKNQINENGIEETGTGPVPDLVS